jgi:hypothetical protein
MTTAPTDQAKDISILLASPKNLKKFTFPVGLEGMTFTFGNRAITTQALDKFWCDALGPAVPTVTLTGHTGWRVLRDGRDGKQQFAYMLRMYQEHMGLLATAPNSPRSLLVLHDPTTGMVLRCFSTSLRIMRDKTRTLLYPFEWDLTVVNQLALNADPSQHWVGSKLGTGYTNPNPKPATQRTSRHTDANRISTSSAATMPAGSSSYTVQSGDNLSTIVKNHYGLTTNDQIMHALDIVKHYPGNRAIKNVNNIYPGEIIYFPKRLS